MIGEKHTTALPPYRRAIKLSGGDGWSQAEMEDNHHHFLVRLDHDGSQVTDIDGQTLRTPWTMCPLALQELQLLKGAALHHDQAEMGAPFNQRQQCTHLFDLAVLAAASAARGVIARRWDMTVPVRVDDRTHATLQRDDGLRISVDVEGTAFTGPAPFSGVSLKRGFPQWAAATLPPDEAEAAILLRRALFVGKGGRALDHRATAGTELRNPGGCFVMQTERAPYAARIVGNSFEFPNPARGPLAPDANSSD